MELTFQTPGMGTKDGHIAGGNGPASKKKAVKDLVSGINLAPLLTHSVLFWPLHVCVPMWCVCTDTHSEIELPCIFRIITIYFS